MELRFTKTFLKDLVKVHPTKRRKKIEEFVFEIMPSSPSLETLGVVEKMSGYESFFKIRFGDYRVGLLKTSTHIELIRVLHRKEIYKVFP